MPNYQTLKPKLFSLEQSTEWLDHLDTQGYVVIKDIINNKTNMIALATFMKEWTTVSPKFNWLDVSTWTTTNSPMVWGKSSVMFNGFGQSEFMWMLRTQPKIKEAFSKIYETSDLAVSFDGFSLFLSDKQQSPGWLHQDQRSQDKNKSIQGLLNLKPVRENDAGFVCVPGSHLTHKPPPSNRDWVMLDKNDPNYEKAVKLLIPKNCLTLWNSKTIHSNTGMNKKHPNGMHINRLSAYITFVPKSRQSLETKNERISGYKNGMSCSHWADRMEIKKLPFHLKKRYLERDFNNLTPRLVANGNIPKKFLDII